MQSQLHFVPTETTAPGPLRAYRLALFALVVLSLGLRLYALDWGMPQFNPAHMARSEYRNSYHIDEDNFLWGLVQMRPAAGNFDVLDYHWGTLQYYLIYGALLGGEAMGLVPAPWETAFQNGDIPSIPHFYELGRLVSVAAGAACTLVVVGLGTMLAGNQAGLAAGLAYAIAPLPVVEAHYLTNDVVMSALVAAAVLAAVLAVQGGSVWWLAGSGLLLGLAIADKYSAVFAALALPVAQVVSVRRTHDREGIRMLGLLLLPPLGALVGFLLGEPYALLAPDKLVAGLRISTAGNSINFNQGIQGPLGMVWWQARNLAGLGLTWPLALLALGGLALMLASLQRTRKNPGPGPVAPLPAALPSLIVMAALAGLAASLFLNRVFMMRYTQPLVPLLSVAAGVAWTAIPVANLRRGAGALALMAAGVITLGQLSLMGGPHTANELLAWLETHLQPRQYVARLWPEYPPLDGGSYRLLRLDPWRPDLPAGARPDYVIMDNMLFGPPTPALADALSRDYVQVATFSAQPRLGPFTWDEGVTPHDWKYSHPAFAVYRRR